MILNSHRIRNIKRTKFCLSFNRSSRHQRSADFRWLSSL